MSSRTVYSSMNHDEAAEMVGHFIVNQLGINLCSVDRIKVFRQADRQIKKIVINLIPTENPD